MKRITSFVLLFALACPAFATGNHPPPKPPKPPKPPATTIDNNQHQGQHQGQGQGQQQGQTAQGGRGTGIGVGIGQGGAGGHSDATGGASQATGGNSASDASSSSAASSGVQGSGNSQLDASDRSSSSYSSRTNVFIPGDLPANAMTIAPGAYITTAGDTECGVLLTKVRTPIYQWDKKGKHKREAGYDEDVAPVFDGNGVQMDYQRVETGNGGYYLRGSHVTYVLATAGGSNNSQLGLQGGGGGGYGGVSYGSGNAYSQAGVRILIRPCIAARVEAKPTAVPARKAVKRKAVKRRAPAQCIPQAAKVCPAK